MIFNYASKNNPQDIIRWTFEQQHSTIVTTSFGEHSAVLLHMVQQINPKANIVWLDTQFNTLATQTFRQTICRQLNLHVITFIGESWSKEIPPTNTKEFEIFVEQVKLAPFQQALNNLQPTFWITGIRREETEYRQQVKHINYNNGIIKVAPLLNWTTCDMEQYLKEYNLPNEPRYFDPTKPNVKSECRLHTYR